MQGQKYKKVVGLFISFVFILGLMGNVFALTGSIGNAKMILRVDQGSIIEKSILVKNVNDVSVDIELEAEGDLINDIKIEGAVFTLSPGQDKKVYFTIDVKKSGKTNSKINVKFTPINGGNGVGLSSSIIVIAKEDDRGIFDFFKNDKEEKIEENKVVSVGANKEKNIISEVQKKRYNGINLNNLTYFAGTVTIILFGVLLSSLVVFKNKQKNEINKSQNKIK